MTKQTYTRLLDSMDKKERNEDKGDYYTFIKLEGEESKELKDFLINLVYSDDGIASGSNNTSYDILYDAIAFINDYTLVEFKKLDVIEELGDKEFASIYNMDRIAYINIYNDSEILSIANEYSCNYISQACAYWYEEQVKNTIQKLQDYTKN